MAIARWQRELALSITDPAALLAALELPEELAAGSEAAEREFPTRVPRSFVSRMRKGDPDDPLLRQVLTQFFELGEQPGFSEDPVGEAEASPFPGLLKKYEGRALLVLTGACAVNCRYCFRRHFPYNEHGSAQRRARALDFLRERDDVGEVILSGGDPLSLGDEVLTELVAGLAEIPHLHTLRIHSRLPVVLPERVDDALLAWMSGTRLRSVLVVHVNHAREIDAQVQAALARLRRSEVFLLNQSVLLRGVNDSVEALVDLSRRLLEAGVLPYYLHLLDRVRGAAHFEVPEDEAIALYARLRERLPGYLLPRLVREVAGSPAKVPVL